MKFEIHFEFRASLRKFQDLNFWDATHLDLDTGGKSVDQKVYRSMIGSLLYLCASRPDIMLSVCVCKIPSRS